jgi:conjugative transfer pilus assembly protein TraH
MLISNNSSAGVGEQMRNFVGENSNYSQGGRYESQSRGYFSTPSFYSRSSVVNVKPVSIAMPSFRGGCGGIDMFAGSFSHVNADQFLALLQAIPSNAGGYAFKLALETISPAISDIMSSMEAIIRDMNNKNLDSCDIGKSIVNSGLSKFDKGVEIVCVRKQLENNWANDIAEARRNCTSGGEKGSSASHTASQDEAIIDINYAWEAVSKLSDDKELKEFIQTITGTIIVKKGANDDTPAIVEVYPSLVTSKYTIEALLDGGSMKKYTCGGSDNKCLDLNVAGTHNISSSDAFYNKIHTALKSVSNKMISRNQELTDEELELMSVSKVPVVAIIRAYQKYYANEIDDMILNSLSEIVAHDLINNYLSGLLEETARISKSNIAKIDETRLKQFQESIKETQLVLNRMEYKMQIKREQLLSELDRTQKIEKEASNILIGRMYNQIN